MRARPQRVINRADAVDVCPHCGYSMPKTALREVADRLMPYIIDGTAYRAVDSAVVGSFVFLIVFGTGLLNIYLSAAALMSAGYWRFRHLQNRG